MKQIIYISGIVFVAILAPIAGLFLAIYTFFITVKAFIEGGHQGIMNNLYSKKEEEPQDIWEKHINKLNLNTKKEKE